MNRFQLFGDTVNTAARMESTGEKDRIQMSQATANLLREAGKGHWLKARDTLVHAKGKGELQTYWFEPQNSRRSIGSTCSEDSCNTKAGGSSSANLGIWGEDNSIPDNKMLRNKHLRLVNYIVDLLEQLLKQLVARRQMLEMAGYKCLEEEPPTYKEYSGEGPTVIDEVVEVIKLATFDPRAFTKYVDPDSIELDPAVSSQLKRCKLLFRLCAMSLSSHPSYTPGCSRNNHCCHVPQQPFSQFRACCPCNNVGQQAPAACSGSRSSGAPSVFHMQSPGDGTNGDRPSQLYAWNYI
jgi:hypothetical protein